MLVREILQTKGYDTIFTIAPEETVGDLLEAFAEHNVGALVVSNDGSSMVGIVSERDVVRKLRTEQNPTAVEVRSIMSTEVETCSPEDPLDRLATMMTAHRVRHIPVLNDGRLVGIVSIGDAVKARMDQLQFERDQLHSYVSGV